MKRPFTGFYPVCQLIPAAAAVKILHRCCVLGAINGASPCVGKAQAQQFAKGMFFMVVNTMQNQLLSAVIFDMDGTLVNTTEADYLTWKKLFADFNHPFVSYNEYLPLLGIKSAEVLQRFLSLNGEALQQALDKKLHYFTSIAASLDIQPTPHAIAFLQSLKTKGIKTALATSSRKAKAMMVLRSSGLEKYFDAFVTGEEVSNGKPSPDIFLKAADLLEIPPRLCLAIEDAPLGVQAAKNALMKCVAITTTHPPQALQHADHVIHSFEDQQFAHLCTRVNSITGIA